MVFVDIAVNAKLSGADSKSPTVNDTGLLVWFIEISMLGISETNGGSFTGSTVTQNALLATMPAASLTKTVIRLTPLAFVTGRALSIREVPVPVNVKASFLKRAKFEDSALTSRLLAAVSGSSTEKFTFNSLSSAILASWMGEIDGGSSTGSTVTVNKLVVRTPASSRSRSSIKAVPKVFPRLAIVRT